MDLYATQSSPITGTRASVSKKGGLRLGNKALIAKRLRRRLDSSFGGGGACGHQACQKPHEPAVLLLPMNLPHLSKPSDTSFSTTVRPRWSKGW